jgi:hypothetical protein
VLLNNLGGPMSVDVDPFGQKVYWTEYNTRKIRRANLDGSNVQDVVTNFLGTYTAPRGISLDLTNSKIYWTFDVVQHTGPQTYYPGAASANMFDGSNPQIVGTVVATGLTNDPHPWGIEYDAPENYLFWGPFIYDAPLKDDLNTNFGNPYFPGCAACRGLTVGNLLGQQTLFYVDSNTNTIVTDPTYDTFGANASTLAVPLSPAPIYGIDSAPFPALLVWGNVGATQSQIFRSKTDGSQYQVVYTAPGFKFYDVAVLPVIPPIPEPASATLFVIGATLVVSLTRRAVAG